MRREVGPMKISIHTKGKVQQVGEAKSEQGITQIDDEGNFPHLPNLVEAKPLSLIEEGLRMLKVLNGTKDEYHHEGLSEIIHGYSKQKTKHAGQSPAYTFEDLPEKCQEFVRKCGRNAETMEPIASWPDVSAAFEMCCMGGNHLSGTCQALATESFNRTEEFALSASVCAELMDLHAAHIDWEGSSNFVEIGSDTRALSIVHRAMELNYVAPEQCSERSEHVPNVPNNIQFRTFRTVVPGTRYKLPGTRYCTYQVHGTSCTTWYLVPSTCHHVQKVEVDILAKVLYVK